MTTQVGKWGNSLAVRIPGVVLAVGLVMDGASCLTALAQPAPDETKLDAETFA